MPRLKCPAPQTVQRAVDTLLEGAYPPPPALNLHKGRASFTRRQDDTDGGRGPEHDLCVMFSADCDAWVAIPGQASLRFRAPMGGGWSPRVHKALIILAEAIRRDNEERPQPPSA